MGDELELLGRMVQGCGTVGGTGEGVRVDDDEAIDMVGMREERDGAPIPGKEYQQQRSIYLSVSLYSASPAKLRQFTTSVNHKNRVSPKFIV